MTISFFYFITLKFLYGLSSVEEQMKGRIKKGTVLGELLRVDTVRVYCGSIASTKA